MMSSGGAEHGRIVMAISLALGNFVRQHALGVVYGAETGFLIAHEPDTVRAPDVAFVRRERVPPGPVRGFFPGSPDLVVEVLSPGDRASDVQRKVQDWLDSGCGAIWLIDPDTRTVTVYRSLSDVVILRRGETLSGGDLVPGFSVALPQPFAPDL